MTNRRRPPVAAVLALGLAAAPVSASRDAGVAYDLTIAGIPIGDAFLRVVTGEGRYRIEGSADFGFLFWGGEGVAVSEGRAASDGFAPESYRLAYQGVTRPGAVEIDFAEGRAARWDRRPEIPERYREGRVALGDDDLRAVLDPLSALVIPAPPDIPANALCGRVQPVFTGYTRFDLAFEGATALDGDAVDCAVRYEPVAGHRPDSGSVERFSEPGAFAVRLAPIGDGVWGPDRVAVKTRFGTLEMTRRR